MELFGFRITAAFLVKDEKILAYSLHYDKKRAKEHLNKIISFHGLDGDIVFDKELEKFLKENIMSFLFKERQNIFKDEDLERYKGKEVYKYLIREGRKLHTYSEISKRLNISIFKLIKVLSANPFLILIPCHRVVRKDGRISGYTPLGSDFKRKLLSIEGLNSRIHFLNNPCEVAFDDPVDDKIRSKDNEGYSESGGSYSENEGLRLKFP